MKLIDEIEFKTLISSLKIEDTVSGGSIANSIVGLSQLGDHVGFIGKVSDDNLVRNMKMDLKKKSQIFVQKIRKSYSYGKLFNFNHTRF